MVSDATSNCMQYFQDLEFDLPAALLRELVELFARMSAAPLSQQYATALADGQGVYQLYHRGKLVYIGKTDNEAGLRKRLLRHCEKISSRLNLDPSDVSFKAVRIYVFTAMDLEGALIRHYRTEQGGLAWNNSGFGSNDPGRKRDHSKLKNDHFDYCHPINLDFRVSVGSQHYMTAAAILAELKENLPYTIRFETTSPGSKRPHSDLSNAVIELHHGSQTVRSILKSISSGLGPDWQITALPGYVIVYRENEHYDHGLVI